MAYSFVKTFGSGEAYDIIAEEIQGTVYFAGEVRILAQSPIPCLFIVKMVSAVLKPKSGLLKGIVTVNGRALSICEPALYS